MTPRHRRPAATFRTRYYRVHWPAVAARDVLETPGPGRLVLHGVSILGAFALASAIVVGPDAGVVAGANLTFLVLLLAVHGCNAVRSRRRRSWLLVPVLLAAVSVGAWATSAGSPGAWDVVLLATFVGWSLAAGADIVSPRRSYLVPIDNDTGPRPG